MIEFTNRQFLKLGFMLVFGVGLGMLVGGIEKEGWRDQREKQAGKSCLSGLRLTPEKKNDSVCSSYITDHKQHTFPSLFGLSRRAPASTCNLL